MLNQAKECKTNPKLSKRNFQPQKIFVERLPESKNLPGLEAEVIGHFGRFGTVIDVKVLRNGWLIRLSAALCLCYFF